MKKLLIFITFLFCAFVSFAQTTPYPNSSSVNNDSTLYGIKGATKFKDGSIITSYTDTASANARHISYYKGALIIVGSDLYYRDSISTNRAYWKWSKVVGNGTSTVSISSDSTALYICNGSSCDTFLYSSIAPIQNFTIINDSTIIVCGISSCDTLHTVPTDYNSQFVTSVSVSYGTSVDTIYYHINGLKYIAGYIDKTGGTNISILNDSLLVVCSYTGCDTFNLSSIAPITNWTVLSDTSIQVCGALACDTIYTSPQTFNGTYVTSITTVTGNNIPDTILYSTNKTSNLLGGVIGQPVYAQQPLVVDTSGGITTLKYLQADGIISGCIVSWSGSGLTYNISPCVAQIGGIVYSAPQNTVTLAAADPTYSRYDVFIVDTTATTGVLTGTPSPSPTVPQTLYFQLPLTTAITINPGDTVPTLSIFKVPYDEGLGTSGGEWNSSTTGVLTVDTLDVLNPFHLTHDVFISKYNTGTTYNLTAGSEQAYINGNTITGHIYTNGSLNKKNDISVYLTDNGVAVTNYLSLTNYGFNKNNGSVYQTFSIPMSAFNWTNTGQYNGIRFLMTGSDNTGTNGFFLDYITIQGGTPNIPPSTDYSNKVDSTTTKKVNDSTYVGLYWIKGISYQKGDTIKIHASLSGTGYVKQAGTVSSYVTQIPLTTDVTGILPIANGGTGTATPSIVAGTNVTVTGSWPNQTINASGGTITGVYQKQTATSGQTVFPFTLIPTDHNKVFFTRNGALIDQSFYSISGNTMTTTGGQQLGDIIIEQGVQ